MSTNKTKSGAVSQQAEDLKPVTQEEASRHEDADWTDLQALSLLCQLTQAPPKTPQEGWNAAMKIGEIALQRAKKEIDALRAEVEKLKAEREEGSGCPEWTCCECGHQDDFKTIKTETTDGVEYDMECPTCGCQDIAETQLGAIHAMTMALEKRRIDIEALEAELRTVKEERNPLTKEESEDMERLHSNLRKYGMIANAQGMAPILRKLLDAALTATPSKEEGDK